MHGPLSQTVEQAPFHDSLGKARKEWTKVVHWLETLKATEKAKKRKEKREREREREKNLRKFDPQDDLAQPKPVDWRNVIEINDRTPKQSFDALKLERASVLVCSSVNTERREAEVRKLCLSLEKDLQNQEGLQDCSLPLHIVWRKDGQLGKAAFAWECSCEYIIDDSWQVINDVLDRGIILCFCSPGPTQGHKRFQGLGKGAVVKDLRNQWS